MKEICIENLLYPIWSYETFMRLEIKPGIYIPLVPSGYELSCTCYQTWNQYSLLLPKTVDHGLQIVQNTNDYFMWHVQTSSFGVM